MKRILFIYPSMILGGSTTSLLSLINCLDPEKYQIDLQLQANSGPLYDIIPRHVNILPEARKCKGKKGKFIKLFRMFFQGVFFRAIFARLKNGRFGFSQDVITDFWAKSLSKKNKNHYDYAISYLEGWSNTYLAYNVTADKKYAWIHSTFSKTTEDPKTQVAWIKSVDKVVFVTDSCKKEFEEILPDVADKALTIANITDSSIIRQRAEHIDDKDEAYFRFTNTECLKIITVCRVTMSVKGLDRVIACAKALRDGEISFVWYIVGDGPDVDTLNKMIDNESLQGFLVLIGKRFNPYPFIKAADFMCMPSRYEGKPLVITESMILGVPPLVTEYLSAKEQIESGVDGIVVANDDTSVVSAILDLARDFDKLKKLKENLRFRKYGNRDYVYEIENKLF